MLSMEVLKAHYKEYATRPDSRVADRERAKKSIVKYVLQKTGFKANKGPVKIVVLGTSDRRYLAVHRRVFEEILGCKTDVKTFDVDTEHLGGESGTEITHDTTKPFPDAPYDIVFSHELMKFLTEEEQLITIINSYNALGRDGIAMHILHNPSILGTPQLKSWQHRVNPDGLISSLKKEGIEAAKLVFDSETDIDWAVKTTVIVLQK
ncbi:MAG: hypothetical protein HYW27_02370 [Candidatus Aenigmarchaeota archaeon]|nr:hypothetical protein [Candidatus Aenigmarchaeota archaeon]